MYFRKIFVLLQPNSSAVRKSLLILPLLFMLLSPSLWAEVVTLRTGKVVTGEILLQNDEVLILRTKNGSRFQYPASEIVSVKSEEIAAQEDKNESSSSASVAVRLQTAGGAVYLPEMGWGGQFALDLMLGTHAIHDTRIFLGAGLGYHAKTFSAATAGQAKNATYSFLPLHAAVVMPISAHKHAPCLGLTLGYGFALDKSTQGGLCAGAEVGWNYAFAQAKDLQISLAAELQQAKTDVKQIVDEKEYINHIGCNFLAISLKLALNL